MRKSLPVAVAAVLFAAPAQADPPIVGGQGLTPNARAVAEYVRANYPGVLSIGGVRPCDWVGEHCRGLAVDVMVGANTGLGDQINADLLAQRDRFGISYTLWLSDPAHWDHIHVSVGSPW